MLLNFVETIFTSGSGTITVVLLTILASLIYWSIRRPNGMPPGPTGLPVVGNMFDFVDTPHVKFKEMTKKYGNVIAVKMGQQWMIVLNQIDVVRDALLRKPDEFAGRPDFYSFDIYSQNRKNIVSADYSATWKLHRKLSHSAIRNFATGKKLERIVHEVTERIGKRIDEQHGKPIDPKQVVCLGIYNILGTLCFAHKYELDDPRITWLVRLSHETFEAFGVGMLADFIPVLRFLPTPGVRRLKQLRRERFRFLYDELKLHRESYDPGNIRDIFDSLLLAQNETIDEGSDLVESLTDTHLVGTINDLFEAGTDTTIVTLHWTLAIMAEYPDIQKKVAMEIDEVVGHERPSSLEDRGRLPYTEATMMEVLRFSSIAPMGVPHATTCDVMLGDFQIPKDTVVSINHYALHFDEDIWDEPKLFKPEHFLDDSGSVRQHPNSFLPFSVGRRSCLGESLAKAELFLIFTWFLQNYEISKAPGENGDSLLGRIKSGSSFLRELDSYEIIMKRRTY
ncbi:steroid 17-alpha-hydroxylase/17,20 lyase-like isoform X1 [Amphiura filiformis]|uniref:steroid 17-alpha-hydroxylase/17,20 lyase-like isoform X1 n=1 Tax=Amphiura filiformis TaxID=82378 RepID=UPI003B219B6C